MDLLRDEHDARVALSAGRGSPAHRHGAVRRVEGADDELREGALAGAALADERNPFARRDSQADAGELHPLTVVAEIDRVDCNGGDRRGLLLWRRRELGRSLATLAVALVVLVLLDVLIPSIGRDDSDEPREADPGELQLIDARQERPDGSEEREEVEGGRRGAADRDGAPVHKPEAHDQDRRDAQVFARVEPPEERRSDARGLVLEADGAQAARVYFGELMRLAAVGADRVGAADALDDDLPAFRLRDPHLRVHGPGSADERPGREHLHGHGDERREPKPRVDDGDTRQRQHDHERRLRHGGQHA